jgi:hypothetical protein
MGRPGRSAPEAVSGTGHKPLRLGYLWYRYLLLPSPSLTAESGLIEAPLSMCGWRGTLRKAFGHRLPAVACRTARSAIQQGRAITFPASKVCNAACLRNWLPFLVYGILASLVILRGALALVIGLFVALPVVIAAYYAIFRDLFGQKTWQLAGGFELPKKSRPKAAGSETN